MKRIDSVNARPNINGTGKTGFHDNADLSGQDATYLTPSWLNQVQEELCNLLEMNGIALNSGVRDQLYQLLATNDDINALAAATQVKLDQEQTWRTDADNWLQQQINNEQTARINAISQEQTWRENADADLENRKFDKAGGTVAGDVTINGILTVLANIAALTLKSNVGGTEIETLFGRLTLTNIPNGGGISQVFNTTADRYEFDKPVFAPNLEFSSWQDGDGYIVLPNGLMFQWGRHDLPNNGGEDGITITFPTPFPNACFNAQATRITASASGDNSDGGISVYSYDNTTLKVHLSTFYGGANGSLRGFTWFAIGR